MEERIVALEIEIAKQEIASIRQLVEKFDQKKNINLSAPFSTQREKLASIIQNTPQCAVEAQGVLDQILALITQLSDAEKM